MKPVVLASIGLVSIAAGCIGGYSLPPYVAATGGNAENGEYLIGDYHCGACHTIRGCMVLGARSGRH